MPFLCGQRNKDIKKKKVRVWIRNLNSLFHGYLKVINKTGVVGIKGLNEVVSQVVNKTWNALIKKGQKSAIKIVNILILNRLYCFL
jgi:hypothetical protein